MNGFTNAILSLLLGWVRLLINALWKVLNSEGGGHFFAFLAAHWKTLLLILCVGGFVVDRIVYLIRWRPYYVWRSKRRRLRREREAYAGQEDEAFPPQTPPVYMGGAAPDPYQPPEATLTSDTRVAAAVHPGPQSYAPPVQQPAPAYQQPAAPLLEPEGATVHYAPIAQGTALERTPYAQPYQPPENLSPVYDDQPGAWEEGDTMVQPAHQSIHSLAHGLDASFGAAKPEPIDYIRDMQAGFARPVTPEQLYAPAAQPTFAPAGQAAPEPQEPPAAPEQPPQVHPGLDMANFRRNIGLSPAGPLGPEEPGAAFRPYAETEQLRREAAEAGRRRNPFANLAKKARGFVGVSEEEDKPTIRDLQSTVDVHTAFHQPVYPKSYHKEDDRP